MTMPNNLVLIRHGQSEANVMQKASNSGNHEHYTEEVVTTPDRSWRLTLQGAEQAEAAGKWVSANLPHFDRHMVSPFIRTRETAVGLALENEKWEEYRSIRERSWGEISSISKADFRRLYPQNAIFKETDPLYWAPPAGESIAGLSEGRTSRMLTTLNRENSEENVLMVTHGEFIWSTRLTLEHWSDEEFVERDSDPEERIHNCMVVHYTRIDPVTGEQADKLRWVRKAWPILVGEEWIMNVSDWEEFDKRYYTNSQLLAKVNKRARTLSV